MFLLTVILFSVQILFVQSKADCKTRLSKCDANVSARNKPVCGSDNQTYPSRCALLRVQCHQDNNIEVKHRGRCREKQPCWAELQGLRKTKSPEGEVFMPSCLPDGRYASVQCHGSTGYCWCVTGTGAPIPNTSVRHVKPTCPRRGKMKAGAKGGDRNKDCKKDEKLLLMHNVVRIFRTEFYKVQSKTELDFDSSPEERAVEWKFGQLDEDASGNLTESEFDQVKKLIRKVVKPKKCSRIFIQLCDTNKDGTLTQAEWTQCMALPKNKRKKNNARKKERIEPVVEVLEELDSTDDDEGDNIPLEVLQEGGSHRALIVDDIYRNRDEPEVNDCLSDRKAVLDEQKFSPLPNSKDNMYVPECTPDGRYKRVQCYNSTGYCWCVEEDTGKPIPGTSVKDSNPKCDVTHVPVRPMKGCPGHKKREFLKNLMEYFVNTMNAQKNSSGNISESGTVSAGDEQVATWNFATLDVDKNKVLEQNEWKQFKAVMQQQKPLRRCGKKLPRHCDVNKDNKISLSEWLNCLNVNTNRANRSTPETSSVAEGLVASPRRRGPNPLEILKGDDD